MDKRIIVKAPDGLRCPKENGSGWITGPETVPLNRYYRRLVNEGSLIIDKPQPQKTAPKKKEAVNADSK